MAVRLGYLPEARNPYIDLIAHQQLALISEFTLESGVKLESCQIAYKTWGVLNEERDNVLVVCHALSGSSDVEDWWGPMMGAGKAFDFSRYFIFCGNILGSPYGSASPLTINPVTQRAYGPEFPETTVRDDIRAHKMVLDAFQVHSVSAVVGGSMGGMVTLEWPLCTPAGYVKSIIPIATAADHSAWGISWAEAQRQCIYADPKFDDGYYNAIPEGQPATGLAAARMVAMLTYRSHKSFHRRFGRRPPPRTLKARVKSNIAHKEVGQDPSHKAFSSTEHADADAMTVGRRRSSHRNLPPTFSAQGYLQYQGEKFIRRFDANCYIHLTHKMDSHDITRGRLDCDVEGDQENYETYLREVLKHVPPRALVIGVETDTLFCVEEQATLARVLPEASLSVLKSSDGHDGFLLEFEALNDLIVARLQELFPQIYAGSPLAQVNGDVPIVEDSVFGEAESGW